MNYEEKYRRLIEAMRKRLKDNMTPLASKHTINGILAEIGENK